MNKSDRLSPESRRLRLVECAIGLIWIAIIAACLLNRDAFTLEGILSGTPGQPLLAALVLLALFALKSLSVFLYSGLLYAASGVLFSLPAAIAVNLAGTAVMCSIPYWLGYKLGHRTVEAICRRFPKAVALQELQNSNDFFFVMIVRLLDILPTDVVSAYMGASGIAYRKYLPACLVGLLPPCILFPIMGMSLADRHSPKFFLAAGIQLAIILISCTAFHIYRKKHQEKNDDK